MSSINRVGAGKEVVREERIPSRDQGPAPKAPAFDATKAAIDNQIVREKPVDAFTAAITEAQDGDGDEAVQRRLSSGVDDDERAAQGTVLDRVRKSKTEATNTQPDAENVNSLTKIAQRERATESTEQVGAAEIAPTKAPVNKLAQSHKELMLISSTVSRAQTATLASQTPAQKVQNILGNDRWVRDILRNKYLKMALIGKVF